MSLPENPTYIEKSPMNLKLKLQGQCYILKSNVDKISTLNVSAYAHFTSEISYIDRLLNYVQKQEMSLPIPKVPSWHP